MTLIILESVLRQLYQDISEHSREVSREVDQSDHLNGNIAAGLGWTQPHSTESNKLAKESIFAAVVSIHDLEASELINSPGSNHVCLTKKIFSEGPFVLR